MRTFQSFATILSGIIIWILGINSSLLEQAFWMIVRNDPSFQPWLGFESQYNGYIQDIQYTSYWKIIAVGVFSSYGNSSSHNIIQMDINGNKDAGFNMGGFWYENGMTKVVEWTGCIYVFWYSRYYNTGSVGLISKLTNTWKLDTSFQVNASTFSGRSINNIIIQSDWKILVTSSSGSTDNIIRLNTNGTVDGTFTSLVFSGVYNNIRTIALQGDGKIVVGWAFSSLSGQNIGQIARLTSTGIIDSTFGTGWFTVCGGTEPPSVASIKIDGSGSIVAGGNFSNFQGIYQPSIIRLTSTGAKDPTFVATGWQYCNVQIGSVLVDTNNNIYVWENGPFVIGNYAGTGVSEIIKFTSTGAHIQSFKTDLTDMSTVYKLLLESGGKILALWYVGSWSSHGVARFSGIDGTRDSSYIHWNIRTPYEATSDDTLALQTDGKILVVGGYTHYNGTSIWNGLIRINTNGAIDTIFNAWSGFWWPNDIIVNSSGKILLGGSFNNQTYQGQGLSGCILQLSSTGWLEFVFTNTKVLWITPETQECSVRKIKTLSGWKLIAVGSWYKNLGGWSIGDLKQIVRFTNTWEVDRIYNTSMYDWMSFQDLEYSESDGKLTLIGGFNLSGWMWQPKWVIRYNQDGTPDYTLNTGIGFYENGSPIFSIKNGIIDSFWNIIVGGPNGYNGNFASGKLIRINSIGTFDSIFPYHIYSSGGIEKYWSITGNNDIFMQSGGRILFGSIRPCTQWNWCEYNGITRLTPSGQFDTSFDIKNGFNGKIGGIKEYPDGRKVIIGGFSFYYGMSVAAPGILVLNDIPSRPDLIAWSDTGDSSTDNITRDTQPTFYWTGCDIWDVITLHIGYSGSMIGSTLCSGGSPSYYSILPTNPLIDGNYIITVKHTSSYWTTVDSHPLSLTVDTTISLPTFWTGNSFTGDSTPTISGSWEIWATVLLTISGSTYTNTVNNSGIWSITPSTLQDGIYQMQVYQRDIAGNISSSTVWSIGIDTTPPGEASVTYPQNNIVTSNTKPVILGLWETGSSIFITVNGNTYSGKVDGNGKWFIPILQALTNGGNALNIKQRDGMGNTSTGFTHWIHIDPSISNTPLILYPVKWTLINIKRPVIQWAGGTWDPTKPITINLDSITYPVTETLSGWILTLWADLTEWVHTMILEQKNLSWMLLSQSISSFIIDTVAPGSPTLSSPITRNIPLSGITNFSMTGSCTFKNTVEISWSISGSTLCTATGWSYTTNVSSLWDGNITVTLKQIDAAKNISPGLTTIFTKDTIIPTIFIQPTNIPEWSLISQTSSPITVLINVSESLSGLELKNISVSSGMIARNFLPVGWYTGKYTFELVPDLTNRYVGTFQVSIPANAMSDLVGNGNQASNIFTYVIDTLPPNAPGVTRIKEEATGQISIYGTGEYRANVLIKNSSDTIICDTPVISDNTWKCVTPLIVGNQNWNAYQKDIYGNISPARNINFHADINNPYFILSPSISTNQTLTGKVYISVSTNTPTQTGIDMNSMQVSSNATIDSIINNSWTYLIGLTVKPEVADMVTFLMKTGSITDGMDRKNISAQELRWYGYTKSVAPLFSWWTNGIANLQLQLTHKSSTEETSTTLVNFQNTSNVLIPFGYIIIQLDPNVLFQSATIQNDTTSKRLSWESIIPSVSANISEAGGSYDTVKHQYRISLGQIYPYATGSVEIVTKFNTDIIRSSNLPIITSWNIIGNTLSWSLISESNIMDNQSSSTYIFDNNDLLDLYFSWTSTYSGETEPALRSCSLEEKVPLTNIIGKDINTSWAKDHINTLIQFWIVKNLENYRPSASITRGEFVAMIVRSLRCYYSVDELESTTTNSFWDVNSTDWYAKYIGMAELQGWLPENLWYTFRPNEIIKRRDAITFIMAALGDTESMSDGFEDISDLSYYIQWAIISAQHFGIIDGFSAYGMKYFLPENTLSRAEAAKIIDKAFLKK